MVAKIYSVVSKSLLTRKNLLDNFFLIILFLLVFLLKSNEVGSIIESKSTIYSTLDFSWLTDSVERLLHGYVLGRDFIFTYGPLFQIIYALPSIIFGVPSYTSVVLAPITLALIVVSIVIVISKLIIKNKEEQAIYSFFLLFIVGLVAYDPKDLIRVLLPLLYSLLLLKFIPSEKKRNVKIFIVCLLPTFFGLFSYDVFIYMILIVFIFSFLNLIPLFLKRSYKKSFIYLMLPLLIIFTHLIFSLLFTGNLNYVIYSLDTAKNYYYIMNIIWLFDRKILLLFPILLILIFIYLLKDNKISSDTKKVFLFMTIMSLLQLKTSIIRSDPGHIIMGLYPSIIVAFTLLYFLVRKHKKFIFLIGILYILIPFKPIYNDFSINHLKFVLRAIREKHSFFSIYKLPESYYFQQKDFDYFSKLIKHNPQNVFVYPHDNFILNIYGSTYNSFPLQFYGYSNAIVEKRAVELFSQSPPNYIILGIDDVSAARVDLIPNFTRNPLFSKWLLSNYSLFKEETNYLVLKYDVDKPPDNVVNFSERKCDLYELKIRMTPKDNFLVNFFEAFTKPSIYHLEGHVRTKIRIPYKPGINDYLIFYNHSDVGMLKQLFKDRIDFTRYYTNDEIAKKITITKEHPFLKTKEFFDHQNSQLSLICFN